MYLRLSINLLANNSTLTLFFRFELLGNGGKALRLDACITAIYPVPTPSKGGATAHEDIAAELVQNNWGQCQIVEQLITVSPRSFVRFLRDAVDQLANNLTLTLLYGFEL